MTQGHPEPAPDKLLPLGRSSSRPVPRSRSAYGSFFFSPREPGRLIPTPSTCGRSARVSSVPLIGEHSWLFQLLSFRGIPVALYGGWEKNVERGEQEFISNIRSARSAGLNLAHALRAKSWRCSKRALPAPPEHEQLEIREPSVLCEKKPMENPPPTTTNPNAAVWETIAFSPCYLQPAGSRIQSALISLPFRDW